jgi:hypothetical protein
MRESFVSTIDIRGHSLITLRVFCVDIAISKTARKGGVSMDTRRTSIPMVLASSLIILSLLTIGTTENASASKPTIDTATWNSAKSILKVVGQYWGNGQSVIVSNPATGDVLGTVQSDKKGNWTLKVSNPLIVPCLIWAESVQGFAQKKVQNAPAVCSGSPGTLAFGFNNLGMHCYDNDYSVFSILPPFNTVNAQVVRRGTGGNKPVILDQTQANLYYWAVKDEKGSINKTSKDRTNFWDYV